MCPLNPLTIHLARGAIGLVLAGIAVWLSSIYVPIAILLGVGALIAFQGCPMCWLSGLAHAFGNRAQMNPGDPE